MGLAGPSPQVTMGGNTFRIFTKADTSYSLSIRDGRVVLAPANPGDNNQHWYKNVEYGGLVRDPNGRLAFALVNKGTGQAIRHPHGHSHPVEVVAFDPNDAHNALLWTKDDNWGEGYSAIWRLNHFDVALDAEAGNTRVRDGTKVNMWQWNGGVNQLWRIVPY